MCEYSEAWCNFVVLHHLQPLQFPHLITHTLHMTVHMCTHDFSLQGVGAESEAIQNFMFDFKNYSTKIMLGMLL